jgi:hypothetical protein
MKTLILGAVLGAIGLWSYGRMKELGPINWLGRVLFLTGFFLLLFGIATFTGSMIEHEAQAGWMGLGAFGFLAAILFIIGRRYGINEKQDSKGGAI